MILCPNCYHRELAGAIFCTQCGSPLVRAPDEGPTTAVYSNNPAPAGAQAAAQANFPPSSLTDAFISLHILDSGEILPLAMRDEITLGRISTGQPIIPDVDLTPYRAYDEGVSRLHVSLKITDNQVQVIDLGSANGTRLNGKKLPPQIPHLLNHGDILTLGRFKIQVLIHN